MSDKFPGSWTKVLVLCGVIVAAQVVRVVLLQPTMARWSPEPASQPVEVKASTESANLVTATASDVVQLMARYERAFTPELDAGARRLAEQRGLDAARLPAAKSIFMLLAGRDMLVEPDALKADLPVDWEIVCGDEASGYVCLSITNHINYLAVHEADLAWPRGR